ncbi:uncharacterized protein A1O5_03041 [Cladophialophora psammophila CBS 110553]|uniref:Uncharacterized protein n=1 Tax=Cladophialophora psammophila CBS 110553 TaxID=1182543 RepID=W9X8N0_9EURO|nr:uncharacterized protein A1O5_03041 [Cladophialophora psammophila CBS 110553]EXJ73281.1 hypothetical protein A1O5_03041 [Cladophialophora psammophila CBS 110553]
MDGENENQLEPLLRQQTPEHSDHTLYTAGSAASNAMPDSGCDLPSTSEAILCTNGWNFDQSAAAFQYLSPTQFAQTRIWASIHADVYHGEEDFSRPVVHDIVDELPINTALVGAAANFHPPPQEVTEILNHNALSDPRLSICIDTPRAPRISQIPRNLESSDIFRFTGNRADPLYQRQRKRRCLCCRVDKGNRPCLGYPLCQRCSILPGIQATPPTLTDIPYLDWRLWFFLCRDLGENIAPFRKKYLNASPLPFGAVAPIVLDLVFEDRMSRHYLSSNHLVVFQPRFTVLSFVVGSGTDQASLRAPAICMPQLDLFVIESMWGEAYSLETSHKLSDDENDLFSTARLFTGYFCLLHNLGNTVVDSGSAPDFGSAQFLSMEMIYTLAFRLQMLFSEFATLCTKISQKSAGKKNGRKAHAVVVLYALEVVYRVAVSMKTCTWDVPADNPFHPLLRLWTGFTRQSRNILSRILAYECYCSGVDNEGTRMTIPPIVEFARSGSCRSLPSHLSIFAQRQCLIFYMDPFPSLNKGPSNQYLINLLACPNNDFTLSVINGSSRLRKRFPEYMVAQDNSKVFRSEVAVTSKDDPRSIRSTSSVSAEETLSSERRDEPEFLFHISDGPSLQFPGEHDMSFLRNDHPPSDTSHMDSCLDSSKGGVSPLFATPESFNDALERLLASNQRQNNWRLQRSLVETDTTPPAARLRGDSQLKQVDMPFRGLKRKWTGPKLAFRD